MRTCSDIERSCCVLLGKGMIKTLRSPTLPKSATCTESFLLHRMGFLIFGRGRKKEYLYLLLHKGSPYLLFTLNKYFWKAGITHQVLNLKKTISKTQTSLILDYMSTGNTKEIAMLLVHKIQYACLIFRKSHLLKNI